MAQKNFGAFGAMSFLKTSKKKHKISKNKNLKGVFFVFLKNRFFFKRKQKNNKQKKRNTGFGSRKTPRCPKTIPRIPKDAKGSQNPKGGLVTFDSRYDMFCEWQVVFGSSKIGVVLKGLRGIFKLPNRFF